MDHEASPPLSARNYGLRLLVMFLGVGIYILIYCELVLAGYHSGGLKGGFTEILSDQTMLGLLTGPWLTILIVISIWCQRHTKLPAGSIVAILIIFCLYSWFAYSEAASYSARLLDSNVYHTKYDLSDIAWDLKYFQSDHGYYPKTLDELSSYHSFNHSIEIPADPFNTRVKPEYALVDAGPTTSTQQRWLLWFSGPDQKRDIQNSPELNSALRESTHGLLAPWLVQRSYDPTNGASSTGDIFLASVSLPPR